MSEFNVTSQISKSGQNRQKSNV